MHASWKRFKGISFLMPVLLALAALLAACQSDGAGKSLADALPRDKARPAFAFFYTDG